MKTVRSLRPTLALLACVALLVGCSSSNEGSDSDSDGTTTIRLGFMRNQTFDATQLGIEKKIFAKHGLKLEIKEAASPAAIAAQLTSGQLDIGFSVTPFLLGAVSNGAPLQIISAVNGVVDPDKPASSILVPKDSSITSVEQLAGQKVAEIALGSELDILTRIAVDRAGGDWKSVQSVQIPFEEMGDAMRAGRVAAIVETEPFRSANLAAGARSIAEPEMDILPNATVTEYVATKEYIASHGDTVKKFQAAMADAIEYAKAHPEEAKRVVGTLTGLKPEQLEQMNAGVLFDPKVNTESIKEIYALMKQYGFIEKPVDVEELFGPGVG